MEQINFQVQPEERLILQYLADSVNLPIDEYVKQKIFDNIKDERSKIAFYLLQERKISRKLAWLISGLSYHEFMLIWVQKGFTENISDQLLDQQVNLALNLTSDDIAKLKRTISV